MEVRLSGMSVVWCRGGMVVCVVCVWWFLSCGCINNIKCVRCVCGSCVGMCVMCVCVVV